MPAIEGTDAAETIVGTPDGETVHALGDNDKVYAGDGDDTVFGNDGNDSLNGGKGNDLLDGGDGFDFADYNNAPGSITVNLTLAGPQNTGGDDIDTLIRIEAINGSHFGDRLTGDGSANQISGNFGNDIIRGGAGNDFLIGDSENDELYGEADNDKLSGGLGNDRIDGGAGFDFADYNNAVGRVFVNLGIVGPQDTLADGSDTLIAIEAINGSHFDDTLIGDDAANQISGNFGKDVISGSGGNDYLIGDDGSDELDGGNGSDRIDGGANDDTIFGSLGDDVLFGGAGADRFVFELGDLAPGQILLVDGGDDSGSIGGFGHDVIELPGKPNDYTFVTTFSNGPSPTLTQLTHLPTGARIDVQGTEFAKFSAVFDNAVKGADGTLAPGEIVAAMVRLGNEVYGPLPTLSHIAEVLASVSGAVPDQTSGVANEAAAKGWHPLSALELGIAPNGTSAQGITYALTNGVYQAVRAADGTLGGDRSEANALVAIGLVGGVKTLTLSFRGTDQFADFLDYGDFSLQHYAKFAPLIAAVNAYVKENGIAQVLVSGHSLGGGMVQEYMAAHLNSDGVTYRAVTIGSPGSDNGTAASGDARLVNFAHSGDPIAMLAPPASGLFGTDAKGNLAALLAPVWPSLGETVVALQAKHRDGATIVIDTDLPRFFEVDGEIVFVPVHNRNSYLPRFFEVDGGITFVPAHNRNAYLDHIRQLSDFATDSASPFYSHALAAYLRGGSTYSGGDLQIALAPTFGGTRVISNPGDNYVLGSAASDTIELRGDLAGVRVIDGGAQAAGIGDTVVLRGAQSAWTVSLAPDGHYDLFHSGQAERAAELWRIETLLFPDVHATTPLPAGARALVTVTVPVVHLDGSPASAQQVASGNTPVTVDPNLDYVDIGNGDRSVTGSADDDFIILGAGVQTVLGNGGNDIINAQRGTASSSFVVTGGSGDDTVIGGDLGSLSVSFSGNLSDYAGTLAEQGRATLTDMREGSPDGTDFISGATQLVFADRTIGFESFVAEFITANLIGTASADTLQASQLQKVFAWGLGGDDRLVGNSLDDWLDGGDGSDLVISGNGTDTLVGGNGTDTLIGGNGDDTYHVDNAGDWVIENVGEGTDQVRASTSYQLTDHVENLTLTGSGDTAAAGNALANVVTGNAGNNWLAGLAGDDVLDGGLGADRMEGGADNDSYWVDNAGDWLIENAGEGTDQVLASTSYQLTDDVENLTLTGSGGTAGAGNALANVVTGNAGNNWLAGLAGDDVLDGGLGGDRMDGGSGDDTYHVDDAGDWLIENAGEGTDRVLASITYQLADNLENLTLTGSGNTAAAGNALANAVTGNAGNNWLAGLAGDDVLDGGLGGDRMEGGADNDTYHVDDAGDWLIENAGEGTDWVQASITYQLADNLENLLLTGSGNTAGAGNALANAVTGNAGNNWLAGLAGNDVLVGGLGADRMEGGADDDSYNVDDAGDWLIENPGEGTDRVQASISYQLADNVENLLLTGSGDTAGGGNALANLLIGNAGANWLAGLAGNDVLDGGLGADRLDGGTDQDTFVFTSVLGGGNVDWISDFAAADDTIALDHAVFTGLAVGALASGAFAIGAAATEADDRIIYDDNTGALLFDADGVGGTAAVQFATLSGGLTLTSADFLVI